MQQTATLQRLVRHWIILQSPAWCVRGGIYVSLLPQLDRMELGGKGTAFLVKRMKRCLVWFNKKKQHKNMEQYCNNYATNCFLLGPSILHISVHAAHFSWLVWAWQEIIYQQNLILRFKYDTTKKPLTAIFLMQKNKTKQTKQTGFTVPYLSFIIFTNGCFPDFCCWLLFLFSWLWHSPSNQQSQPRNRGTKSCKMPNFYLTFLYRWNKRSIT